MGKVYKKLIAAVEGRTTDGRMIEKTWIEQMAESYNSAVYRGGLNWDHWLGGLGEVQRVETMKHPEAFFKGALCLTADIELTDQGSQFLSSRGGALGLSVEIEPNFLGQGKAYLMGLAATNHPASAGTDPLKFSTKSRELELAQLKIQHPEIDFSQLPLYADLLKDRGLNFKPEWVFTQERIQLDLGFSQQGFFDDLTAFLRRYFPGFSQKPPLEPPFHSSSEPELDMTAAEVKALLTEALKEQSAAQEASFTKAAEAAVTAALPKALEAHFSKDSVKVAAEPLKLPDHTETLTKLSQDLEEVKKTVLAMAAQEVHKPVDVNAESMEKAPERRPVI